MVDSFNNLVSKISKNSKKYASFQKLIPVSNIKNYNPKIKYTILYYFSYGEITINRLKQDFFLPKVTSSLKYYPNKFIRYKKDSTYKVVEKMYDSQKIVWEFYDCICKVAYILTLKEAQYLINYFIYHKDLKEIAKILKVSCVKLSYIEKSCLIKIFNKLKTTDLKVFC